MGHSRGGWTTKSHALVDASGHLCSLVVTPGQAGENPRLLDVIDLAPHRVVRVVADKAYSHPSTRTELRRRRIKVTIPERSDQIARRKAKGSRGGRPPAFDPTIYKGRNVVERFFNRIKEFRAIATRYDKLARNYRAGLVLASTIICLRDQLRDTPYAAMAADSRDLVTPGNDAIRALRDLPIDATFLRAERGMVDEPGGLFPSEWVAEQVARQPRVEVVEVPEVNHYTITLSDAGAAAVATVVADATGVPVP